MISLHYNFYCSIFLFSERISEWIRLFISSEKVGMHKQKEDLSDSVQATKEERTASPSCEISFPPSRWPFDVLKSFQVYT